MEKKDTLPEIARAKAGILLDLRNSREQEHSCFEEEDQTPTTKFMVHEHDTTESSESEWQNPFAVKSGGDQNEESCFHLNEDDELPYPKFKKEVERILANEV
ncbi:hypothetical protein Tco_1364507, partial [Tanacetum coccineum]